MNIKKAYGDDVEMVWRDRKRFMGMPLSFTRYMLLKKGGSWMKVVCDTGLLYSYIDEVNVYRICDVSLHQSLSGKLFNTGTIILTSSDETRPKLVLKNVKDPMKVREVFSNYMEEQRRLNNIRVTEFHGHN